jgi:hypothetical protein
LLGDKGYDSDAVRQEIVDHGGEALIPTKANRKVQYTVDKAIYGLRNRIERFFNRLKTHGASQLATINSSRVRGQFTIGVARRLPISQTRRSSRHLHGSHGDIAK